MARTVKDPDVRRNEIVDVAQALFLSKGYDNTSVQDVLDGVGIAKGTFYHYFGSKVELLDSLIDRLTRTILQAVEPIVDDAELTAPQKLEAFFGVIMEWKTANRRYLTDLMRVIYQDENALYREKMTAASLKRLSPMLAAIVAQGVDEGVYATDTPAETSAILLTLSRSLGETMAEMLLDEDYEGDMAGAFERILQAHDDAIARILGFEGPLHLVDVDAAKLWIDVREPANGSDA